MDRATHVRPPQLLAPNRPQSVRDMRGAMLTPGVVRACACLSTQHSPSHAPTLSTQHSPSNLCLSVGVTGTGRPQRQRLGHTGAGAGAGAWERRSSRGALSATVRSRGGVEDRREAVEAAVSCVAESRRNAATSRYGKPSLRSSGRNTYGGGAWDGDEAGEEEWGTREGEEEEFEEERNRRRGEEDRRDEMGEAFTGSYHWQEEEELQREQEFEGEGEGEEDGYRGERESADGYPHDDEDEGDEAGNDSAEPPPQLPRVAVFWDLDNKQPLEVRPGDAARGLRDVASQLAPGPVDILAYANRHAFDYVPTRVREERRQRKELEQLERAGAVPASPSGVPTVHPCTLCGRKFRTSLELRKHFTSLHQKEHQRRMAHLNSLGPGRRKKVKGQAQWRERVGRYQEAASELVEPKQGYGLMPELRRAGVHVRLVSQAAEAADDAIREDMSRAVKSGLVSVVCLVSDDRGYAQALSLAKTKYGVKVVVIGSAPSLERWADLWMSWEDVVAGAGYTIQEARSAAQGWSQQREGGSALY